MVSRTARILSELEAARAVSADRLACLLAVTRRTVANEVASLQATLGEAASIVLTDGRYRLLVADPVRYRALRARLSAADYSFNDPASRASFLVGRLFRALGPLRIEDLAAEMTVGRTTVVADLTRVRALLAEADLEIRGRPNVGLELEGPELNQRLYVLRRHFGLAYSPAEIDPVEQVVAAYAAEAGLDPSYVPELSRWGLVAADRARLGRRIQSLPGYYEAIVDTSAHSIAGSLAARLSEAFGLLLDESDAVFLALPIAGRRMPGEPHASSPGSDAEALVGAVLAAIEEETAIDLTGSAFLAEFTRHVEYMLNRMRYRIWVDDTGVAAIQREFPVAGQLAAIASRVIEEEVGLPVDGPEASFLAVYFQVFLDTLSSSPQSLRVVVVAEPGRMFAELLRLQLAKLLPAGTQLLVCSPATLPRPLTGVDLVVIAGESRLESDVPVVRVPTVLDRAALERGLERLALRLPLQRRAGQARSVLSGALEESHFFVLPPDIGYLAAVDRMTGTLEARGLAEEGFGERIRRRNAQSRTQLSPWIGFPHASLERQREVLLAAGVIPRRGDEGVRLIILLGVPTAGERTEATLVQVYEEVLRLGARPELVNLLCRAETFEQFYYLLENNPFREGER